MNNKSRCGLGLLILVLALVLTGCGAGSTDTGAEPVAAAGTAADPGASASSGETPAPEGSPSRGGVAAPEGSASATPTRAPRTARTGSALAMLYELDIKGRAPKTDYDAKLFGWRQDTDRNGCDTRNDVLRRDLRGISLRDGSCVVLTGSLTSPYTAATFDFIRGDGNNIEIDHVVALSNAWQTGAQAMSAERRIEFGNDPLNLLAVETRVNQQKGDGDAATWLPPDTSYRCEYVARQIAVKHKYDLWVVPAEFDAMERLLLDCDPPAAGDDPWPATGTGDLLPTPTRTYAPEPDPQPEPETDGSDSGSGSTSTKSSTAPSKRGVVGSDSSTKKSGSGPGTGAGGAYKNCTEARNRGGAPVRIGQPGYGPHLDRDGDGVGCEAKK